MSAADGSDDEPLAPIYYDDPAHARALRAHLISIGVLVPRDERITGELRCTRGVRYLPIKD